MEPNSLLAFAIANKVTRERWTEGTAPTRTVGFWHFSDLARCPTWVRNARQSGRRRNGLIKVSLTTRPPLRR